MRFEPVSTQKDICGSGATVGRKMQYPDKCVAPLPAGSFDAIAAALREGQNRTDWLREAVAEKLARESKPGTDCAESCDEVNRG